MGEKDQPDVVNNVLELCAAQNPQLATLVRSQKQLVQPLFTREMFRGAHFGIGEGVPPFFGGAGIGGNFKQQYRCYSVAMSPATNPQGLEEGGKSG